MDFIHTHVHSHFSFLDGVASPAALVRRAKEMGMPGLVLSEHGNMFSAIPFYEACKEEGIKAGLGIEGYVSKDRDSDVVTKIREKLTHIILIAKNPTGYANLCRIVSDSYKHFYYKPRMSMDFISKHAEGIICTTACLNGVVSREFAIGSDGLDAAARMVERLKSIFKDDLYVEVMETGVVGQRAMNEALLGVAGHYNVKTVVTNDVHYIAKEDAEVQDMMLSLAQGTDIMDRKRAVVYGVFPEDTTKPAVLNAEYWMKSRDELQKYAPYIPKECFDNVLEICDKVQDVGISFSSGRYMPVLPKRFLGECATDSEYLREVALQGLVIKGLQNREEYIERLNHELGVIDKLNFSSYFLILSKIVDEVRKRDIMIGPGRGSGAGSLTLYCLGITGIDPIKYGLMFERFLNPERIDLPDVDVDFEQSRRQEVVDVAIGIFGADRVSKLATFNNMTTKLAIREAIRGMEPVAARVDDLVKSLGDMPDLEPKETFDVTAQREEEHLRTAMDIMRHTKTHRIGKTWYDFAMGLSGAPKAVSIHASGVVISKDPFDGILPTFRVNQESETALMADMHTVSKLGFVKFDLLGLTTLDVIKRTCEFIKKNHKIVIDPYDLPLDDKLTYQLLQSGNTCRVFQMEGGGFTDMLKGLKPTEFEHIIAMNALYRPGPLAYDPTIKMSMAEKYIRTKNGDMLATSIHELIDDVLKPTHYMMLFQEQIMEVSRRVAGYTMAEADNLRKIIGKKLVDKIEEEGKKFVTKAISIGKSEEFAEYIWGLIKPAGRYCVTGNTTVMMADGTYKTMGDIVKDKICGDVMSFNDDMRFMPMPITKIWSNGKQKVYRIVTRGGVTIECTVNHDVMTDDGKKSINGGLVVGDALVMPNVPIDVVGTSNLKDHEIIGLAHMLAEGYLRKRKRKDGTVRKVAVFTNKDGYMLHDFKACLVESGNSFSEIWKDTVTGRVCSVVSNQGGLADRVDELGCDVLSGDKFILDEVFRLTNDKLRVFIGRLYSGDGDIYFAKKGGVSIKYTSKSEKLVGQISAVLSSRFGIKSIVRTQRGKRKPTYTDDKGNVKAHVTTEKVVYVCVVSDRTDAKKFAGIFGEQVLGHKKALLEAVGMLPDIKNGIKSDILGLKWSKHEVMRGYRWRGDKKYINRETLVRNGIDGIIANQNIRFDVVESIEDIGEQDTYCITVDGTHSFIANGCVMSYQSWNRAHAAAYGMISYITAWLKAHYPAEFMCANLIMVDAKQHRIIIDDCKRMGIVVARPDINYSTDTFSVSDGKIYIGMSSVKGVGSTAVKGILAEREARGLYKSFVEFVNRNKMLPSNIITQLTAGGSFVFDEAINRREIIENISDIKSHVKTRNLAIKTMQQRLSTAPKYETVAYRRAIDTMNPSVQFDLPEDVRALKWFKPYGEYELAKILELESDAIGLLDVDMVLDKYQSVAALVGAMSMDDALRLPPGSRVLVYGINGGVTVKYPKTGNTWTKFGVVAFADRTSVFDKITINTEDLDDRVSQGENIGCIKSSLSIKYGPVILQAVLRYSQKRGPQLTLTGKALLPQFGIKISGINVQNLSVVERLVLKQTIGDFAKMEILTSDVADVVMRATGKGRAYAKVRVGASGEN